MRDVGRVGWISVAIVMTLVWVPGNAIAQRRSPPGIPESACRVLDDPHVIGQMSAAGERLARIRCGFLTPPRRAAAPGAIPQDTATGRSDILLNARGTDTYPDVTQSETSVAVLNGTVVVGWNDANAGSNFTGYARSTNSGTTWTDAGTLPTPLGGVATVNGDPVVMADRNRRPADDGVLYFANLGTLTSDGRTIIAVHKSIDGGATWTRAANASPNARATDALQDKEWMAVDTRPSGTGAGNVYVCWRRFGGADGIQFSRSTDGSATFTQIGTISTNADRVQGCQVAVSPVNGNVYVSWTDSNFSTPRIRFRSSTTQGDTWTAERTVAAANVAERTVTCGGTARTAFVDADPGATQRAIRSQTFPAMSVDPVTGFVYVAWHGSHLRGGSRADIAFSRSTDSGMTWGDEVRINGVTTGQQFFPAIASSPAGETRVIYYSTENSPSHRLIDLYEVTSIDRGATWSPPVRITDQSFDRPVTNPNFNPGISACYMGDYNGIATAFSRHGDTTFAMAWGDNRLDGDPDTGGLQADPDIRFHRSRRLAGGSGVSGDFDGDGAADLAVGVPGEDGPGLSPVRDSGMVNVIYGTPSALSSTGSQVWSQNVAGVVDTVEAEDFFGQALATGNFNGDAFDDLAVGVPGEDHAAGVDVGAVAVLYGSAAGLQPDSPGDQLWHQDVSGIIGASEPGDLFGSALASGDFDDDGFDDLAVGVPGEDLGTIADAGLVNVVYGTAAGIASTGNQTFDQGVTGIAGDPESGDLFGSSLASADFGQTDDEGFGLESDLAIGVPGEDIETVTDAGAVAVVYGTPDGLAAAGDQLWDQDATGVAGVEAGDLFGSSLAAGNLGAAGGRHDLAIGAPGEDVGLSPDAGAVVVLYGTDTGLSVVNAQLWEQGTVDVEEVRETGDRFGSSLASGDLNGGISELAIGVPGEDIGSIPDAGAVNVLYGVPEGLSVTGDQVWHQDVTAIEGMAEAGDQFGAALTIGLFGQRGLAIGVPGEAIGDVAGAGAVNVIYREGGALGAPGDQVWSQDSSGIPDLSEAGDAFGSALA